MPNFDYDKFKRVVIRCEICDDILTCQVHRDRHMKKHKELKQGPLDFMTNEYESIDELIEDSI